MKKIFSVLTFTLFFLFASACSNQETMKDIDLSEFDDDNPIVVVETSMGDFEIELFPEEAPISVENFLEYVESEYYDGTIFHRVIKGFMVQGGGFNAGFSEKTPRGPIKNEADNGLRNEKGTVAMARTSVVDSATAQFFINTANNSFLDHGDRDYGYAVFGEVVSGMDIIESIENVETSPSPMPDSPVETVEIISITLK